MDKSLYTFIWKHSKSSQITLLIITLATFPIQYLSLELPKRIVNDAIGGTGEDVPVFGIDLSQIQFLLLLCVGFLLAVLVNGLIKMRINTMKGVLSERMLRRLRYDLLQRVTRFPRPFFRRTSQGELVSMVTSEAEPLGGLMGDLISQPVFQAGQMLTILAFLFAQSFWFGLASIALIPLQAWLIPMLQRQINLLNKSRIQEVRKLASEIGETAAGVSDLRTNGGLRYRMSLFSDRLGRLFDIRFEIFQKKFFMKFLNNFINQLTPFFFYSVGGVLAINGEITVGALVAALAAYKDLSNPWKELLIFYNTTQDMSLRWEVVTERFSPSFLVDEKLFDGEADEIPRLNGDIELKDVTVIDEDGNTVLEDISLVIPSGARVAVKAQNETAALAFADVLTREVIPHRGTVTIGGVPLNDFHQSVLGNRIGYAHSKPHIFKGSLGENLMMPFRREPMINGGLPSDLEEWRTEAERAGNSVDPFEIDWVDPKLAGFQSSDEIHEWWFHLVEAMGIDDFMVHRALRARLVPGTQPELEEAVVRLRPEIEKRLAEAGLDDVVFRFDPEKFNPVSPLGSNLMFGLPTHMITQLTLSQEQDFLDILNEEGLTDELSNMSATVIEGLTATFGSDGTDHPLFRRLNMDDELYQRLGGIAEKRREVGNAGLPPEDLALMMTVPFAFSAEQIGPAFSDEFKDEILRIRKKSSEQIVERLGGLFHRIEPDLYFPVMSLLGNAIYGRISSMAGAREKKVEEIVVKVFNEHGLRRRAAQSIFDLETTQGGENLPAVFRERIAFSRAGIKRPDILILGNALASHDAEARAAMRARISDLMPDATKVFIESKFHNPDAYDLHIEISEGRVDGATRVEEPQDDGMRQDLARKLKVVADTELFSELDQKQQRLLAFSARWYKAKEGQVIYSVGEEADAAYLCVK
ncbi:MAG: ABC transporter ATP-binding protein/permease, partial [Pseudomonadota bacterium]